MKCCRIDYRQAGLAQVESRNPSPYHPDRWSRWQQIERFPARPPRAAARLRKFHRDVEAHFPGCVVDVILVGFRARGDARPDSDYDVAVFIEYLADRPKG